MNELTQEEKAQLLEALTELCDAAGFTSDYTDECLNNAVDSIRSTGE